LTDERSKQSPNYVFFVTTVLNYLHVRLPCVAVSADLSRNARAWHRKSLLRRQCNAVGKRNLAAIERIVTLKYRRGAVFNRQRSATVIICVPKEERAPRLRGELDVWPCAPANTPAEIVNKLNKEINAGLADREMKARLADFGGTMFAGSPVAFGKLIADETEKWGKVIRAANIKPI
jgi:hypothetical protein